MRINIWIPDKLIPEIDARCKATGMTRSQYLVGRALEGTEPQIAFNGVSTEAPPAPIVTASIDIPPEKIKTAQTQKEIKPCKHGRMPGLCEYGCK